jgi:hypothetical protein
MPDKVKAPSAAATPEVTPVKPDENVDEHGAARILGVSVQTLRNWRWQGVGPHYYKIGRSVRYGCARHLLPFLDGVEK